MLRPTDRDVPAPPVRWTRMLPFNATFALAFLLGWVTPDGHRHPFQLALAGVLVLATLLANVFRRWTPRSELATLVPVAALCLAVDLMRSASGSGATAGYGALLLIPVVWQAMFRNRLTLNLTVAIVSFANVMAVVVLPSPASTAAQWRSIIIFTVISVTIGHTIRMLVSERAALLEQVHALALRDPLTGLPNRRIWDERLAHVAATAARRDEPMTIALLDLDHFKAYNDRFGHDAGDELLVSAAEAWDDVLRETDLLVRWGGEEFALLLPDTDEAEARRILDRLQQAMPSGQTFSAGFTVEHISASDAPDLAGMVRSADRAMYAAKAAGRAQATSTTELLHRSLGLARAEICVVDDVVDVPAHVSADPDPR